jgi:D-alanyl-D-alanine carboxypeptidase/D-alanyl-D-alanine carboxypeptidase (penicillin-binding protein 5/6)
MSKFHRFCIALIVFLLVALSFPLPSFAHDSAPPSVSAESAILIDATYGAVLYEKNSDAALPMASTTKIMTALTALSAMDPQTRITIPPSAIGVEGSSIYLVEGEILTLEELLYALLLESANDAAVAIAIAIDGSVEAFADRMNRLARDLGLKHTHFENPHGLDGENHRTTAHELAIITKKAMENELFCTMIATKKKTISHPTEGQARLLCNHNRLLSSYEGAIGVKTGYTKKSGRCLVSAAERDGIRLIAVTLNAPNDWQDHEAMLNYGFERMERKTFLTPHAVCLPVAVIGGNTDTVMVSNPNSLSLALPSDHPEIKQTVELPRFLYAELSEDEAVGRIVTRCDLDGDGVAEIVGETPLTVQSGIPRIKAKRSFWQWLCDLFRF